MVNRRKKGFKGCIIDVQGLNCYIEYDEDDKVSIFALTELQDDLNNQDLLFYNSVDSDALN